MELRFNDFWWLLALVAVIPAALTLFWLEKKYSAALHFPKFGLAAGLKGFGRQNSAFAFRILKVFILALLALALARPQWVKSHQKIFSEGIDVVVAIDISTSMNAADFQPDDRLAVAKNVITEFISKRRNDRIGLVVFSREAYTQSPLTLDYAALKKVLETLKTGSVEDGTAIGNAVATSVNRIKKAGKSKVVILITDGDNNAGNITPLEAADLAKKEGVKVFTILVGKEGPVPYPVGKDMFGRVVYRNVEFTANPLLLKQIADSTGGKAYTATNGEELRQDFQKVLDEMEKTRLAETSAYEDVIELAPYLILAALLLLIIDFLSVAGPARRFPA